jgi:hypothetical protein
MRIFDMPGSEYYDAEFYTDPSKVNQETTPITPTGKIATSNKYLRPCKGIEIDVYDVLEAFDVPCHAMAHAIKKMLCSGLRGYKDSQQDKEEAIKSIQRSIDMEKENGY